MDNYDNNEDKNLSRTVGSVKDTKKVCDCNNNQEIDSNNKLPSTVIPARDSKNNKQSCESCQAKEFKNLACAEDNKILNLSKSC